MIHLFQNRNYKHGTTLMKPRPTRKTSTNPCFETWRNKRNQSIFDPSVNDEEDATPNVDKDDEHQMQSSLIISSHV